MMELAHLSVSNGGAQPGGPASQFTIGTLVRLLSGHGSLPGHASCEAGRSAGHVEDNSHPSNGGGVRRPLGQTGNPESILLLSRRAGPAAMPLVKPELFDPHEYDSLIGAH
ncbi:hypothetical protein GCM10007170_42620 [Arthrobacter liuii]|uniref:Uncharacterized protein n=1 Tax=Arthrobacter liuii TaxID=1476996 RepID=A0ABQ2B1J4_9MICC|nr:hypothetical protein GCM10007170_42620 [Arthrobacter liuii]